MQHFWENLRLEDGINLISSSGEHAQLVTKEQLISRTFTLRVILPEIVPVPYLLVHHIANEPNLCFKEGTATSALENDYHRTSITVGVHERTWCETSPICTLLISVSNLLH